MPLQGTKRITVHKVMPSEGSLFSSGIGFDDDKQPIDFIGHTAEMLNIKTAIDEYEDGDADGLPTIFLKPWQWNDQQ